MSVRAYRAAVIAAALAGTSCGGSGSAAGTTASAPRHPLSGALTVFAAASLSGAFTASQGRLQHANPGLSLRFSFAGSQQLVAAVIGGAPADVVATADDATMQRLVDAGLVGTPRTFARNSLEIVVAPGNPKHISGLADLAAPGLAVVLADPSVPAGRFAAQALARTGVRVSPKAYELDVESVLRTVVTGDADAAIVYSTDARTSAVTAVPIPPGQNVVASYPVAVVTASTNRGAASAFIEDMLAGAVHAELARRGFLPP